jgi:hypothetical protein
VFLIVSSNGCEGKGIIIDYFDPVSEHQLIRSIKRYETNANILNQSLTIAAFSVLLDG